MASSEVPTDRVAAATAALERVRVRWLGQPGVTAVDVGLPGDANPRDPQDEPVLRVHVEDRRAAGEMAATLPRQVDGFAVRVIEARYGPQDHGDPPP